MRDRLIELGEDLILSCKANLCEDCEHNNIDYPHCMSVHFADYLLANGVIVPPMKLGQTCFEPCEWRNEVDECRVSSITQKADGSLKIRITNLHYRSAHEITTDGIGKTVFLTREDAEKAFKGGTEE